MRDIDTAFATLNQQVSAAVRPPAPAEIVRRARRRRATRTVVASIVAVAVVGTGAAFLAAPRHQSAPLPTKPTPSVSESPTPTPTSSSPSPSSSASTSLPAADPQPLRRLPVGLLLYSDKTSSPEWKRDQKTSQPWLFMPCVYGSLPGDTGRIDAESMREVRPGADEYSSKEYVEQVVVYRDAETAKRVMDGWRNAFKRDECAGDEGVRDSSRVSMGDEAIRISHRIRGGSGEWSDEGQRGIIMRVTNVVVLYYRQDTYAGHAIADSQFATPERDARRIATRICELTRCDN